MRYAQIQIKICEESLFFIKIESCADTSTFCQCPNLCDSSSPVVEGGGEVSLEEEGEGEGEDDGDERQARQDRDQLHPLL